MKGNGGGRKKKRTLEKLASQHMDIPAPPLQTSVETYQSHSVEQIQKIPPVCAAVMSPVCLLCLGSVRTGSATAAFRRTSGAEKTAFTRRDGHRVGDGDALPGGKRGREGCGDVRGGSDPPIIHSGGVFHHSRIIIDQFSRRLM